MSRYIDVSDLNIPSDENDYDELVAFADKVAEMITDAPSIDIVRCKECKHWDRAIDENGIERFNFSKCVKGHYGNGFDFYCADGEREGE